MKAWLQSRNKRQWKYHSTTRTCVHQGNHHINKQGGTGQWCTQAVGRPPQPQTNKWGMVQRRKMHCYRRDSWQSRYHQITPQSPHVWPPRDQQDHPTSRTRLLVATHEAQYYQLHKRMCRMSMTQSERSADMSSTKPNLPKNWSHAIRNGSYQFYH